MHVPGWIFTRGVHVPKDIARTKMLLHPVAGPIEDRLFHELWGGYGKIQHCK